jgi:hypothetical protein
MKHCTPSQPPAPNEQERIFYGGVVARDGTSWRFLELLGEEQKGIQSSILAQAHQETHATLGKLLREKLNYFKKRTNRRRPTFRIKDNSTHTLYDMAVSVLRTSVLRDTILLYFSRLKKTYIIQMNQTTRCSN